MIKYWIKNRFIFSTFFALLLSIISLFVFVNPNLNAHSENILLTSVYENSEINFDIPSPTKNQLNDIRKLDFVDDVFGYYFTESNITINNKSVKTKILFSDMLASLDFTMYNKSRLISSEEKFENPIYVDYKFIKDTNTKLGDEVIFQNIIFQIGRIYETNTYYGSAIFAPLVGEQKDLIESLSKSYSGAYLKVNDTIKAEQYLINYKPEGRLKDRSEFDTDEEYEMHFESWSNANYYNEITSFDSKFSLVNLKNEPNYIIAIVIIDLFMFSLFIILSLRKSEHTYFSKKKDKNSIKNYYILSTIFDFILILSLSILTCYIGASTITNYIPSNYINLLIMYSVISSVVLLIADFTYSFFFYKKILLI